MNGSVNYRVTGNKHTDASTDSGIGCNKRVKLAVRAISQNKLRIQPEGYG